MTAMCGVQLKDSKSEEFHADPGFRLNNRLVGSCK